MRPLPSLLAGLLLSAVGFAQQPLPPEQQAEALLTAGQKSLAAGDINIAGHTIRPLPRP